MITFHDLYQQHAADVYRFAYWLSGNVADAEDIASETFVRAWAGWPKIRANSAKGYLFTIARNLFLQRQRHAHRHTDLNFEQPDPRLSPLELISARDELEKLHRALQTLPEIDRAAFLMRVEYEMSYSDIAGALSISVASAKVKVHRTRLKLVALKDLKTL